MSEAYKIQDKLKLYFVTTTVVEWIDIFDKKVYKDIIVDSLNYCIENKGLEVYSWVIMSNHIHLIIGSEQNNLSDIIRDFKRFTSIKIIQQLKNSTQDNRREWILPILRNNGLKNPANSNNQMWQQPYFAKEIFTMDFLFQKLNYIHMNPVRAGIVDEPKHYKYSSAGDYCGNKGLVEVKII